MRKIYYLILFLGAFIVLSAFNHWVLYADEGIKTTLDPVKSGVWISKYNQHPVFTMGSKVATKEDISLCKDQWISYSYQPNEGATEEIIQAAINGQKKGLHLLIDINEDMIDNDDIYQTLGQLSQYSMSFMVSLIPGPEITGEAYNQYYHVLKKMLSDQAIENVTLIWYPQPSYFENQMDQDWDQIDGVGVNISGPGDMVKLDRIYEVFANKKGIIINERIIDTNRSDLQQGLGFLQEFYYALAVKYPAVKAVYQSSDLSQADTKYRNAIENIKQKSWVTNFTWETTEQPMFAAITSAEILRDQVEFLYRPKGDNYHDISYVEYKFNTERIIQASRQPFAIRLDTNQLHNGINALKVVVYDKQLKIIDKRAYYFGVKNENIMPRAPRIGKVYTKDQKPAYTGSYIPVLMYHDFASLVPKDRESNTVAAILFEKQIKALLKEGYTPVTFYDLDQYLSKKAGLPLKPVIITTDDGYLSNYTIAYPLLKKYKIPATFFITTGFMGVKTQSPHISWAQAKEMEESGYIDIQSHTHMHKLYNVLKEEEAVYEISISFGLIEKYLGKRDVKVFSYPEFRNTIDSKKWIEGQGIDLQVTNLAKAKSVTSRQNVQRIHVHNKMSPEELIKAIKNLTK